MKITVIGCGAATFAAAADLSSRGYEVTLFVGEKHAHNFKTIKDSKIIKCYGVGPVGDIKIHNVTTNIEEALANPDLIMPVIPSYAHEQVARQIAPYIKPGDKIFINPGSTGGALVFAKVLGELGKMKDVAISEVHTLPYTARKVGSDGVKISLLVEFMYFAAFPAKYNQEMYELIHPIYSNIRLVNNVLEVGMNNGNATTHAAPVVLNAGKIEYYHKNKQFAEAMTPSVCRVVQTLDDERKAICHALGFEEVDIKDRLSIMGYVERKETLYECIQTSVDVYLPLDGPNELNHRFIIEDVPYCMVPMAEVAKVFGIKTPTFDAIINLASILLEENYFETGRNLSALGLAGKSMEEINDYLENGYREW